MSSPISLRFGPSGWLFPDWDAIAYPRPRPRGFHPLSFLSRYFDAVEINTTFFRDLRPEVARLWLKKVEERPDFRFTALLHRRFTYDRQLDVDGVAAFKQGLWPLFKGGRLGCLVMQFPWSFRFTEENRAFFIQVRRTFHEFPLAAEMRHASWIHEEAIGTFIDHHVGFCNVDQPRYTKAMTPSAYLTSRIGYARLTGRGQSIRAGSWAQPASEVTQEDYLYSASELGEWKPRIEKVSECAEATFVVTANHGGAKSLVNALQLQAALSGRPLEAPWSLVEAYPEELAAFDPGHPVQPSLFRGPGIQSGIAFKLPGAA